MSKLVSMQVTKASQTKLEKLVHLCNQGGKNKLLTHYFSVQKVRFGCQH